ncbi:MAG: 30S ribosomal protein S4 [Candidatus Brocadiae bacterium]|nr:30S ribosomal protein S4 [Candidatus Brocadiia bacterium]
MARITGRKVALSRREGVNLHTKGGRYEGTDFGQEKPPGVHGDRRPRPTDYGIHLREKQKCKRWYGVLERQFRRYFDTALHMPGNTGQNLLILLEGRLDNAIYRLGFAPTRAMARQMVVHGHVLADGKRVTIPSWAVKPGVKITFAPREGSQKLAKSGLDSPKTDFLPTWLQRTDEPLGGVVVASPTREEVSIPIKEQLIVEFCSK